MLVVIEIEFTIAVTEDEKGAAPSPGQGLVETTIESQTDAFGGVQGIGQPCVSG